MIIRMPIFDAGENLGALDVETEFENDSVIQLIDVTFPNNEKGTVLVMLDMEYGILIPEGLSKRIKNIIKEQENEK